MAACELRTSVFVCKCMLTTEMNACEGWLNQTAISGSKKLVIKVKAPRRTFAEFAVPTADGFVPGTDQSFSAEILVRAFKSDRLIESHSLVNGALEFGGRYRCASE